MTERLEKMRMELRRGVLVLAVLATLREEHYGYSLRKKLRAVNMEIEEGTLYPLIRRLETYGLLSSEWRENDGRRKRYYKTSAEGEALLGALRGEWRSMNGSLKTILEDGK
jgi:DNA-binding PadR family transcriptional regulator